MNLQLFLVMRLHLLFLLMIFSISACQPDENEESITTLPAVAYVNGKSVNLRSMPDTTGTKIAKVSIGDSVYCRERSQARYTIYWKGEDLTDYWYKVEDYRGHYAWIFGHFLLFNKIVKAPVQLPIPPLLNRVQLENAAPEGWRKTARSLMDKAAENFGDQPARWFVQVKSACDFETPEFRTELLQLIKKENTGLYNLGQVCDIFDYCVQWKYVNDPSGREYFSAASETLKAGRAGDCDDFAILVASGIMTIGGEARVVFAGNDDVNAHAFAELNLGQGANLPEILNYLSARYQLRSEDIHYRMDSRGDKWLNLDWFADKDHPGEAYYSYVRSITFYVLRDEYESDSWR